MNWSDTLQAVRNKAFPRTHALECELSGLRDEHARVTTALDAVRDELERTRERDADQLAELQQRLETIDAERTEANRQAQSLETSLAEAMVRQQDAEQHIRLLETKLDETRSQHETSIGLTQKTMLRLQTEQHSLLGLQSDLATTFNQVGKQLIEAAQLRAPQPRLSTLQTAALSGLLFLSGALAGGMIMRGADSNAVDISAIERGIGDLQQLMKAHFESHDELLRKLIRALDSDTALFDDTDDEVTAAPAPLVPVLPKTAQGDKPGVSTDPLAGPGDVPLTDRQIADLQVLGHAAGQGESRALAEFSSFYLPVTNSQPAPAREEVEAVLVYYANQARADGKKYRVDEQVLAAIRLGSLRTGVDFSFLMELAAAESGFDPAARAATSDAAGLYQFRDSTWLDAVHNYGDKYGLGRYADRVKYVVDSKGTTQPTIADAETRGAVLGLRYDPRLSALLAAEHVRKNMQQLSYKLERQPGRTELYLTHFFGASGAISFLQALAEDPGKIAGEIFPGPASRNRPVFQNRARKPRTIAEVYKLFDRKFNTARYEDGESG